MSDDAADVMARDIMLALGKELDKQVAESLDRIFSGAGGFGLRCVIRTIQQP
jgi:hypothetical protein